MSSKFSSFILYEQPDITEVINFPLKNAQRVKYTCFDISKNLIVFGATSGGIYVFSRSPCEFIQLIPNNDGVITRVSISPDEKHIGFANGRGIVSVTECNQQLNGVRNTDTSKEHHGNEITAMTWSTKSMLFIGDDVGKVSVLQVQNFIAKTMFQNLSQIIMSLDSRVCQIDIKETMLLVSTFTRCYVCDTVQEQYRQIGQKLRDGEFGACFVNKLKPTHNGIDHNSRPDITEVRKFNIANDETEFIIDRHLQDTLIYCARPSSRLWEASIYGEVTRTHQFKQFLSQKPTEVITLESYNNQNVNINEVVKEDGGQSVNFPKLYQLGSCIFSFKKNCLYFLNITNVEDTMWCDKYKDIIDCKVLNDILYIWLSNGSIVSLKYIKIEKFILKCYIDEKFILCGALCSLYRNYLMSSNISSNLHILVGLRDILKEHELERIKDLLDKFENLKDYDATQMNSGIYVVDNTYQKQSYLLDNLDMHTKTYDETVFKALPPEALQTLKDLSHTVTDKLNFSKRVLKERWDGFEEKMKYLAYDKQEIQEVITPIQKIHRENTAILNYTPSTEDEDLVYKEPSQIPVNGENGDRKENKIVKLLYEHYRLSLVSKKPEQSNLVSIINEYACDIKQIYEIMLHLEEYCISIGAVAESNLVPNYIFLSFLNYTPEKDAFLDSIISDEVLYKYFVNSCISVNVKTYKHSNIACECGYPLPFSRINHKPIFSDLIDEFIEKQWLSPNKEECYEICKKMPHLWKKILYLQRNDDLLNVLRILLQMLDESLLHSFLPQFTLDTWDRAIQLYSTLHANVCLNCNRRFYHVSVKDMVSWDRLGALMIKSIGGRNALKMMEKHAHLIDTGEVTTKFYHTLLLVEMFEKIDTTVRNQLTDALYTAYDFQDARLEICQMFRKNQDGKLKNTALPIVVAANATSWGLRKTQLAEENTSSNETTASDENESTSESRDFTESTSKTSEVFQYYSFKDILENIDKIIEDTTDCILCWLPLKNLVLLEDGGLWVFKCGHVFHGGCLDLHQVKLCPSPSCLCGYNKPLEEV